MSVLKTPVSATQDVASFLERSYGPEVASVGFAYTAISDDANALYFNPAGLITGPDLSVSAMYFTAFEAKNIGISYQQRFGAIAVGAGAIQTTVEGLSHTGFSNGAVVDYHEFFGYTGRAFYAGIAHFFQPDLSAGMSVKYISEALMSESGAGTGMDLGILYTPGRSLRLGARLLNVGGTRLHWDDYEEIIDAVPVVGIAYRDVTPCFGESLQVSLDVSPTFIRYGIRFMPLPFFTLSAGIDERHYSLGTMLRLTPFSIQFSYTKLDEIVGYDIYRVGIGYSLH